MSLEVILGVFGIVVAIVVPIAVGYRIIQHENRLERKRKHREIVGKLADQYVFWFNSGGNLGVPALAKLGMHKYCNKKIRDVIQEIEIRTGQNPLYGIEKLVEGVDLKRLFRDAREKEVDLSSTTAVEEMAKRMKAENDGEGH